ncbi:MAG: endonuclease/exonuclease/phosphatase family protein [Pirellulales bacterium]|nr:endonuclease/exonuclease/phosphatase family protein [Pirellulales bacterium]
MPRLYPLFLVAILAGGGWYFTNGPGQGKLGDIFKAAMQRQASSPYATSYPAGASPNSFPNASPYAGGGPAYGYSNPNPSSSVPASNYSVPPASQVPAIYASQSVPGAVPPPAPAFGGPAIRIASFNIQTFGDAKAAKPYVMATLAAIIQNFHVVAIQEIRTQDDYFLDNFLRTYVNVNGRQYDKIVGPRLGRSNSKEQYAYLYDTAAIEVNRRVVFTVNDPDDLLHREPLVAMFRVRGPPPEQAFTFVLVNVHTDPDVAQKETSTLAQVYQVVRRAMGGEDDIILLGDFNVDEQHLGDLGKLDGVQPVVRGTATNTRQGAQNDNIILNRLSTSEFSGRWGVYNVQQVHNLTLDQALQVSDHLPIWAEFSAYESATPGRMAAGNVNTLIQ